MLVFYSAVKEGTGNTCIQLANRHVAANKHVDSMSVL
jgi:hypothetical protein